MESLHIHQMTKKGKDASMMTILTKQKRRNLILSPCSERIVGISYTQHKETKSTASNLCENIPNQQSKQTIPTSENFKRRN